LKASNNDFSIHVATVNGSGSQTANTTLMRSIFQMGVPVSGKNLFPSNIAGLPTWFTIRVNENGYVARTRRNDVLVAMNPETSVADIGAMGPGSILVLNEGVPAPKIPEDRVVYKVPFDKLVQPLVADAKLRKLVVNMVYVGVVSHLLGIDFEEVDRSLTAQLGRKPKALDMNRAAVKVGAEYAAQNLKPAPFRVERRNKTDGKILIEGNQAAALGAMFGGVTFLSWYPITPSSSLAESLGLTTLTDQRQRRLAAHQPRAHLGSAIPGQQGDGPHGDHSGGAEAQPRLGARRGGRDDSDGGADRHRLNRERRRPGRPGFHAGALRQHDHSRHGPHLAGDVAAQAGDEPHAHRTPIRQALRPAGENTAPCLDARGVAREDRGHRQSDPHRVPNNGDVQRAEFAPIPDDGTPRQPDDDRRHHNLEPPPDPPAH